MIWSNYKILFSFSSGEAEKVFRTFTLWQRPAEFKQKRQHKFSEMTVFYPHHWYSWNNVEVVKNIQCFEENYLLVHLKMFFIKCHHVGGFEGGGLWVGGFLFIFVWFFVGVVGVVGVGFFWFFCGSLLSWITLLIITLAGYSSFSCNNLRWNLF